MIYLVLLVVLVVLCLILKIGSRYLYVLTGLLIFLHPLLLAKGQVAVVYQLSIVAFLVFLSALLIDVIMKVFSYQFDEQDSFVINRVKRTFKFRLSGVMIGSCHISATYWSIILAIVFIVLYAKLGVTAAAFGILLSAFVTNRWSPRIIAACALLSLSACPFLLIYKQEALAESFAVYAYYFLTLTVVLLVVEQVRDRTRDERVL